MKPRKIFAKSVIAPFICVLFVLSGILTLKFYPSLYEYILKTEFVLTPTSKSFRIWQETPMPMAMEFYLWNWTNPEDITNSSVKPKFVEMGPYRFVEKYKKVDITWNDNDTVSFRQLKTWHFDEKGSKGTLEDKVTNLNPVAVSASFAARNFNYIMKRGLSITLSALVKNIYSTKTVAELLYDGYSDRMIDMVNSMPAFTNLAVDAPPWDKFAWMYDRNNSAFYNGILNMATGTGKAPMGWLENWNYEPTSRFYKGKCSSIHGAAGEFFPPHRTKDENIIMFSPELCRTIEFEFEQEQVVHGVRGYKYVGGPKMVDNGTLYPENTCYCNGECVPSGLLNVSSCRYGSPGFISFPHYYLADPYYLNKVEGPKPDVNKHQFYVTIEPTTGIPLEVAARFQINILLQPIEDISYVQDMPRIFFPMIWFEQHISITPDLAVGLFTILNLPVICTISGISMICLGLISLLIVVLLKTKRHFEKLNQKKKMILSKEEVPLNDTNNKKIKIHPK